jgi:hypothetical protein
MDKTKYIGMDVHKEAISIAVLNFSGKLAMECIIETKASTILQFFQGLSGSLHFSGYGGNRDSRPVADFFLSLFQVTKRDTP